MTLTVRSATVTGATTANRALTHAEMDANWAHVIDSANQTFTPSGTGAQSTDLQTRGRQIIYASDYTGYDATGASDSATAINNAIAAGSGGAVIEITGTPLIASQIVVDQPVWLVFKGSPGNASSGGLPGSYLIKKSTMTDTAIVFNKQGSGGDRVAVVGQAGNTGDGIAVQTNGIKLRSPHARGCGNDGIRVGKDTTSNCNSATLEDPVAYSNGRHGIYIYEPTPNANVCTVINPQCLSNTADGIRVKAALYTTIIGGNFESNGGYGRYLESGSNTTIIGGDAESNSTGDLFIDATANNTQLLGIRPGETITDNCNAVGSDQTTSNRTRNYSNRKFRESA